MNQHALYICSAVNLKIFLSYLSVSPACFTNLQLIMYASHHLINLIVIS